MINHNAVPKPKNNRSKLSKKLAKEIRRSILLSEKDKNYWIGLIPSMPDVLVGIVYGMIRQKNDITDHYIEIAMAGKSGKKYLIELKTNIVNIKKRALEMDENAAQENNENILQELSDS